jgi:hypothetical protein
LASSLAITPLPEFFIVIYLAFHKQAFTFDKMRSVGALLTLAPIAALSAAVQTTSKRLGPDYLSFDRDGEVSSLRLEHPIAA